MSRSKTPMIINKITSSKSKLIILSNDTLIDGRTYEILLKLPNIHQIHTTDTDLIIHYKNTISVFNYHEKINKILNDNICCKFLVEKYLYTVSNGSITVYDIELSKIKNTYKITNGIIMDFCVVNSYIVCCTDRGKVFFYDTLLEKKLYISLCGMFNFSGITLNSLCLENLEIIEKIYKKKYENNNSFLSFFKISNIFLFDDYEDRKILVSENKESNFKNNLNKKIEFNEYENSMEKENIYNFNENRIIKNRISIVVGDENGSVYFIEYYKEIEIKNKIKIGKNKVKQIIKFMNNFYCICDNMLYKFNNRKKRRIFVCGVPDELCIIDKKLYLIICGQILVVSNGYNNFFDKILL